MTKRLSAKSLAVLSDELRAVAERDATANGTQTLRALLRDLEWVSVRDCVVHHKWEQCCPICGGCQILGHAPACRLAAALRETS